MNTVQFRAIDLLALSRLIATFVMFVAAIPMVTAQEEKAKKELETAEAVAARVVRDCFKWVLCPYMANDKISPNSCFCSCSSSVTEVAECEIHRKTQWFWSASRSCGLRSEFEYK